MSMLFTKSIKVIVFFIFSLATFTSFSQDISYEKIKDQVEIESDSSILIFLFNNNSSCGLCNIRIYNIYHDTIIRKNVPNNNVVFIVKSIREAEKKYYREQFSYFKPPMKIIGDDYLYNYFSKFLPETSYQGGVLVIGKNNEKCVFPFNAGSGYEDFIKCIKQIRKYQKNLIKEIE